jgi:enoyl-CoA hydratase/carnithine racemase
MAVYAEKDGPVTVVILSRPEVRNAVDRKTAEELSAAFRAFESDASARVAVLTGGQGHFCAGADLTKIADGMPNRVEPNGTAKKAATELARQIAVFPQICLRGDRLSAIEQFDQPFEKAMANEFKHGLASMAKEAGQGAARFAKGAGRHGEF